MGLFSTDNVIVIELICTDADGDVEIAATRLVAGLDGAERAGNNLNLLLDDGISKIVWPIPDLGCRAEVNSERTRRGREAARGQLLALLALRNQDNRCGRGDHGCDEENRYVFLSEPESFHFIVKLSIVVQLVGARGAESLCDVLSGEWLAALCAGPAVPAGEAFALVFTAYGSVLWFVCGHFL
jgi:hypothetical protein